MENKFLNNFIKAGKNNENSIFTADGVIEGKKLGSGNYGDVSEVEIEKGKHKIKLATKDYSKDLDNAEMRAERAYKNYLLVKSAGLKVFPTMRISEDKKKLLMTLGTNANNFIVSKGSEIKWEKIKKLDNLDSLITNLKDNIKKASLSDILLESDLYFLLINKSKPNKVDFVIGDYDLIRSIKDNKHRYGIGYALSTNVKNTIINLRELISMYVEEKYKKEYIQKLERELFKFEKEELSKMRAE